MKEKSIIKITPEILKNPQIRVFSQKEPDGDINYILALDGEHEDSDSDNVQASDRLVLAKAKKGYKTAQKAVGQVLSNISNEKKEVNIEKLLRNMERISDKYDIEFTNELVNVVRNYDAKEKKEIEVGRENKLEEILKIKEEDSSLRKQEYISYEIIDKKLEDAMAIDVNKLPRNVIETIAADVQERMTELDNIVTPEDADRNKGSLIAYMKYREVTTDEDRVIEMFVQNAKVLDLQTVVECLKALESKKSEDSKLYSVYLKLEERRVIDRIEQELVNIKVKEKSNDGQTEKFLEHLDKSKFKDIDFSNIEDLEYYIITYNLPEEILEYVTNQRRVDFELLKYIKERDIKSKEDILGYLESKIVSVGQLCNESEKTSGKLRTFIENTEYKVEDKTDSNKFLLLIARMEKDYIQKKYGSIIKENDKLKGNNSKLQSYEKTLSGLEQKEKTLQEEYEERIAMENRDK